MHYLILGTLFNDDAVINDDGEIITPATPMLGYHLNTSAKLEGLDAYLFNPSTPKVKLNTDKQYFYMFADESEFNSFCMIPVYEPQQEEYTYFETDEEGNQIGGELTGTRTVQVDTGGVEFNTALFIPNVVVPQEVTMRQARLALLHEGLLGLVASSIEGNEEAKIEWEYSSTVQRDNVLISTLAASLGLSGEAVGALFIKAGEL